MERAHIAATDAGVVNPDQDLIRAGNLRDGSVLEASLSGTVKKTREVLVEMISCVSWVSR